MALFESDPDTFKLKRSSLEQVTPGDFMSLYASIGRARAISWNPGIDYMNPDTGRTSWSRHASTDIEVERWATSRTKEGQLVDIRLFGEGNPLYANAGVVAMAGIAPTAKERIQEYFVLNRGGNKHWVTSEDADRSFTLEELYGLIGQLDAINLSNQPKKPDWS